MSEPEVEDKTEKAALTKIAIYTAALNRYAMVQKALAETRDALLERDEAVRWFLDRKAVKAECDKAGIEYDGLMRRVKFLLDAAVRASNTQETK